MEPETKIAAPIQVPAAPSSQYWTTLRRRLRYATLGFLGVVFCATLVFWIRSYWRIDHLHGILPGEHRLFVRSGGGEIVFTEYTLLDPGKQLSPSKSWSIGSHGRGERFYNKGEFEIMVADSIAGQSDSGRPVRILWNESELYTSIRGRPSPPLPSSIFSHGIAYPHLLFLLITGSLFFLILRRWQYSLREIFIWVTIICVAMACAVAFTTAVKEIEIIRGWT